MRNVTDEERAEACLHVLGQLHAKHLCHELRRLPAMREQKRLQRKGGERREGAREAEGEQADGLFTCEEQIK